MLMSGCSTKKVEELGRFTIISSKNVELARLKDMKRSPDPIKTKHFNVKGLFVRDVKLAKDYQLENALNSALEQIPGAVALLDAKIRYFYHNGLFKEEWGYLFEGTALVDSQLLSDNSTTPQDETIYFLSREDNDLTLVSKEEYHSFLAQGMKTITK